MFVGFLVCVFFFVGIYVCNYVLYIVLGVVCIDVVVGFVYLFWLISIVFDGVLYLLEEELVLVVCFIVDYVFDVEVWEVGGIIW